jgi:hypothetical protein
MRRIVTTGAACALAGLLAGPALADCVQQIVHVKQMADQASDPAKREMAVQHLGMAQGKVVHVMGSPMQGEMMSEDPAMAMKDDAMKGEAMADEAMADEAMKDEAVSEDATMAMKDEAMKGEAMAEDHGEAMKDEMMSEDPDMAMMEEECMAEVMKAQAALQ